MSEAALKTCFKYGIIAYEKGDDYEARANLMWTGSIALNHLFTFGKGGAWSVHPIEHELSAFYDILKEVAPQSIGGAVPGEDFYWIAK